MIEPQEDPNDPLPFKTKPVAPAGPVNTGIVGPETPPPPAPSPFDRTQFRDAWMGTGADRAAQDQLLQQHGLSLDPAGRTTLPTGEIMDLRYGAKAGGSQATWTGAGGTQNGVPVNSGPAAGAGGAAGSAPGGDFQSQIRALLLQRLQGGSTPDLNSPEITAPMEGARLEASRGQDAIRKALAERMAAGGGVGTGELNSAVQQSGERMGTQLGSLRGQLIQRAFDAKRQEFQQNLALAMQSGDAEAVRATQMQLAQLDAELRRMGLSQQADQWNDSFGLNAAQFQYGKDKDLAMFGGGY